MDPEAPKSPEETECRRLAYFHPTVWGDFFIDNFYTTPDQVINSWSEQLEVLKEEAREIITDANNTFMQKLIIVDTVQRLGVGYYYEGEIQDLLEEIFDTHQSRMDDADLHCASLCFRLLRQQGYNISSDILKKFKDDKDGFKFKQDLLTEDVPGVLSLYEASFLGKVEEEILDEAQAFSMAQLDSISSQLNQPLADKVRHALYRPIRRGVVRHEAWHFISMYEQEEGHNQTLLDLGKVDFNVTQELIQKELYLLARWWKGLDIETKLPFARNRLVEGYFWALGAFSEPQYGFGRIILGKLVPLLIVIDDVYDAYGTLPELELFTEAIERLDEINMKDQLPDYMKVCYQAILDLLKEIDEQVTRDGRLYCMHYAKEALRNQLRAYITEARWLNENYVPPVEEHFPVVLMSTCYPLFITFAFIGLGEIATKEVFEWFAAEPKVLLAATIICRLMGDLVSFRFERIRGHVASTIDCHVKQYGWSEEEACDEFRKRIRNAWQDINEALLKPTEVPMPVLTIILNFARVMDVVYKEEDGVSFSAKTVRDVLSTLLINPFTI